MGIGERVKHYREAAGLSQSDLAKRIGVAQATISHIESGDTGSTKHVFALAKALNVQLSQLDVAFAATQDKSPDRIEQITIAVRDLPEPKRTMMIDQMEALLRILASTSPNGRTK